MRSLNKSALSGPLAGLLLLSAAANASASTIDLAPAIAPVLAVGVGDARSVILRDDVSLALASFGIFIDPPAAFTLTAQLFAYDTTMNTRGALLATNTTAFADLGLAFYDVPLIATLNPGSAYELQMKPFDLDTFSAQFYSFDNPSGHGPDAPFSAGGVVTVIDGGGEGNVDGRANGALAHFELNGVAPAPVPEPVSLALVGTGLAAAAWRRRRQRR
jgi:hypothetical protein